MPSIECIAPAPKFTTSQSVLSPAGMCFVSSLLSAPLLTHSSSKASANGKSDIARATGPLVDLFAENDKHRLTEVSYYDVLGGLPFNCTPDQVKQAYHTACLWFHPDKTGRGEEDAVFLQVKRAWETLSDENKKRTYDSSANFDDSIPAEDLPERKFYKTFAECFERNMRFQVTSNTAGVGKAGRKGKGGGKGKKEAECPEFGDEDTPIEQVQEFYKFWVRFESWRDFTLAASKKTNNNLENMEGSSREEKRHNMKEVEREAKKMKQKENDRISSLVTRAMAQDPRLRRHKEETAAKEAAAKLEKGREAREKAEAEANAANAAKIAKEEEDAENKLASTNRKAKKETEKKLLRKVRNQFRKLALAAFQKGGDGNWKDLEEQNDEVEFLAENLTVSVLPSLSEALGDEEETLKVEGIAVVRAAYTAAKSGTDNEFLEAQKKRAEARAAAEMKEAMEKAAKAPKPWSSAELSALKKAAVKYPAGGANRFEQISLFINNLLCLPEPRSKEECIKVYNDAMAKSSAGAGAATKEGGEEKKEGEAQKVKVKVDPNVWIPDEVTDLKDALKKFPGSMEKNARWTAIQRFVATKDKRQCVEKYKELRAVAKK
jgi:DnaJ family protein C protein 2